MLSVSADVSPWAGSLGETNGHRVRNLSRDNSQRRPDLSDRQCYTDVMSTDELLAEALRLTRVDRARVAEELLSSLEESDEEVATAWATELERRSRESAEGRVQTSSWETARTEILDGARAATCDSNCILRRVPSFAARPFGTTSDGRDWATNSSPRSPRPWGESATLPSPTPYGPHGSGRPDIRKATVQRFPYVIALEKHERHFLVLAVAHARRWPWTG